MSSGLYSGVSGLALGTGLYRNVSGLWGGSSGLIDAFGGGGGPFPGSSLYLDFLTPPLDSRITFSRGTNATLVDSTGKITYAPANLLLQSNSLAPAQWNIASNLTRTVDGGGTSSIGTAYTRLTAIAGNTDHYLQGAGAAFSASQTYIISFEVQYVSNRWMGIAVFDGGYRNGVTFDLLNGVVGSNLGNFNARSITSLGSNRYRVSAVYTAASTGSAFFGVVMLDADKAFTTTTVSNLTATTIDIGLAQLEPVTYQTTPGPYVATTASAYYGPRFDYDPVTLAPRGLLIEEARTNLLLRSGEIGTAPWAVYGTASVSANATSAPDGTTSADLITFGAVDNGYQQTDIAIGASISVTLSFYVKANVGTQIRYAVPCFDAANTFLGGLNNTSSTITSGQLAANGWYRISVTFTTPAGTTKCAVRILGAAVSDSAYVWGAQLEAGAFATSYIPTVASTVSRSADVATMTGTNFSTWYNQAEGTFIVGTGLLASFNFPVPFMVGDSAAVVTERIQIYLSGTAPTYRVTDGTDQVTINTAAVAIPGVNAFSAAYKLNDFAATVNGAAVVTDTSGTLPTVNTLYIGNNGNVTGAINGHIRSLAYYNTRLPNTQLQTLTAPSLASPLALDFISPTYTVGY
jgi:hypothetical protein